MTAGLPATTSRPAITTTSPPASELRSGHEAVEAPPKHHGSHRVAALHGRIDGDLVQDITSRNTASSSGIGAHVGIERANHGVHAGQVGPGGG